MRYTEPSTNPSRTVLIIVCHSNIILITFNFQFDRNGGITHRCTVIGYESSDGLAYDTFIVQTHN